MKKIGIFALLMSAIFPLSAANKTTTVTQVSELISLQENVDYVIASEQPFATNGVVNIVNTDHAVLILQNVRPSVVVSDWLADHVQINGAKAVNGNNCQVKMYAQGAIVFPYANNIKPLTVYSEQNFEGTSCNDFGLENTGGYMNTLTEEKLNNQIRSFKLKRGYMVTFSTRAGGRGYSRCFIADQEDLEFKTLPNVLDKTISSYRVFQWYNAPKKGLASDTRADANKILNSSWCYDWGTGVNLLPDVECVPNHIYEDWPSSESCGKVTYSCHMKTNNEPGNSSDDHPQSVETVLANWENLMRTGLRLCSESSHDGSMSHLKAFIDSIDARGWRCDILDLHCYWAEGTFNSLTWYSDNYGNGRPIWISEWVWGASWNNNGAFSVSDRNDFEGNFARTYNGTVPILEKLNANTRVERYAYWNSEANCSKILKDGKLSTLGEYYAAMNPGLGYNKANEYIPTLPRQYNPGSLSAEYNEETGKVNLSWHEYNGEYNSEMVVQRKRNGTYVWELVQSIPLNEVESDYTLETEGVDGDYFRVRIKNLSDKYIYSNEAVVINSNLSFGGAVTVVANGETKTMYLGGNQLINGDFELGTLDWKNGVEDSLSAPNFQVVPLGGVDGSAYLQCYGGQTDAKGEQSVRKVIDVTHGAAYYAAGTGCRNTSTSQHFALTTNGTREDRVLLKFTGEEDWTESTKAFVVNTENQLLIQLRDLGGKAQFDNLKFCQLFDTPELAKENALLWEKKRVEAVITFNKKYSDLNADLQKAVDEGQSATQLEALVQTVLSKIKERDYVAQREALMSDIAKNLPSGEDATPYQLLTTISNSNFSSTGSWTVSGSYTKGDQRIATHGDVTCWNAWWSIPAATNQDQTMAIKQTVSNLGHGLYALECKAATEHYCETDQHAYMKDVDSEKMVVSEPIPFGGLDLPGLTTAQKWNQLSTSYLYLEDKGKVEVGFVGSKKNAVDKQWKRYENPDHTGDNREGWWCATDFKLRYIPAYFIELDETGWTTICMPKALSSDQVTFYSVAGILADSTGLCLEVVDSPKGGYPYLVHGPASTKVLLLESGTAATRARTVNGLKGVFTATNFSMSVGGFHFVGEHAEVVKESNLPLASYHAYISSPKTIPVKESWEGLVMPLYGYATTSLESVESVTMALPGYTLQGQQAPAAAKGLQIRGGKVIFCK